MTDQFDLRTATNAIEAMASQSLSDAKSNQIASNSSAARLSCELGKMTPQEVRSVIKQMQNDDGAFNSVPVILKIDSSASGEIAGVLLRESKWHGTGDNNYRPQVYGNVSEKFCALE